MEAASIGTVYPVSEFPETGRQQGGCSHWSVQHSMPPHVTDPEALENQNPGAKGLITLSRPKSLRKYTKSQVYQVSSTISAANTTANLIEDEAV